MRRYCLTYDAIDSKKYKSDPTFYRELIYENLTEMGCKDFHMPVASTIIFHYDDDIDYLHNFIKDDLEDQIFYYLCLVDKDINSNMHLDRVNPDNDLGENFYKFLKED